MPKKTANTKNNTPKEEQHDSTVPQEWKPKPNIQSVVKYAPLEYVKYCPNCGREALMQNPVETADAIITCSNCHVRFKLEIVK